MKCCKVAQNRVLSSYFDCYSKSKTISFESIFSSKFYFHYSFKLALFLILFLKNKGLFALHFDTKDMASCAQNFMDNVITLILSTIYLSIYLPYIYDLLWKHLTGDYHQMFLRNGFVFNVSQEAECSSGMTSFAPFICERTSRTFLIQLKLFLSLSARKWTEHI